MIIDDDHKFIFLHIPKCAGTSVRQVLQRFDSAQGRFSPPLMREHPQLGRIDMAHIPLAILRQYFSSEYHKVQDYFSVAVIRDPFTRFSSSVYQRVDMYSKYQVTGMSSDQLKSALDETIAFLSVQPLDASLPHDYIHFQKQSSYVFDQGVRLIDRLYTPQTLSNMFFDFGSVVGERLESGREVHANRRVVYKSTTSQTLAAVINPLCTPAVKKLIPEAVKEVIKRAFYDSPKKKFGDLFVSETVCDFVSEYYAEDIALYKSVVADTV